MKDAGKDEKFPVSSLRVMQPAKSLTSFLCVTRWPCMPGRDRVRE